MYGIKIIVLTYKNIKPFEYNKYIKFELENIGIF